MRRTGGTKNRAKIQELDGVLMESSQGAARSSSKRESPSHLVIAQKRGKVFVRRCLFREVQGRGHTLVGLLDPVEAVRWLNSSHPVPILTLPPRPYHLIHIGHHHARRFPHSCLASLSRPCCARPDAPRVACGRRERKALGECCRRRQSGDNPSCVTGGRRQRGREGELESNNDTTALQLEPRPSIHGGSTRGQTTANFGRGGSRHEKVGACVAPYRQRGV